MVFVALGVSSRIWKKILDDIFLVFPGALEDKSGRHIYCLLGLLHSGGFSDYLVGCLGLKISGGFLTLRRL